MLVPLLLHAGTNQTMGTFGPIVPTIDGRVLAFSVAIALATGIVFGLVSAFESTRVEALRLNTSILRSRTGRWLMAAELTLAIVVLFGAALLIKSFWPLQHVQPGFRADHLLTLQLWLPKTKYPEPPDARRFFDQLRPRIERLQGVRSVGAVSFRPFLGMAMMTPADAEGRTPKAPGDDLFIGYDVVTPGYLRVVGQQLLRGRDLEESDTEDTAGAQAPADPVPVADHHQHLFGPQIVQLAAGVPGVETIDAAKLIALLDAAGIRRAAVLSVAYMFANPNRPAVADEYAKVRAENDWTSAQVARYPDRLRGFCGVNPLKDYALDEIARCANDRSLRAGLKLHFGNSDVNLDEPQHVDRLRAVFRAANDRRMAIAVHMRSSVTRQRPYGAKEAQIFLNQLVPTAPDVAIQIAHLAGAGGYDDPAIDEALSVFIDAIGKGDRRMARVFFDVSGVAGFGNWTEKADLIATRLRAIGMSRLLYGSDGATAGGQPPREAWATFRKLPLTEAEFRKIASNVAPYLN